MHSTTELRYPGRRACVRPPVTRLLLACGLAGALAACGAVGGDTGRPTRFRVGYGEADITPPLGTILGGYGVPGQHRATIGTHDPLRAQAALLSNDAGQAFLIISADLAEYSWDFGDWGPGIKAVRQSIAAALAPRLAISPEQIVIASIHSHAAPDVAGFNQDIGQGPDKALLADLLRKMTDAADAAAASLVDADLWFGATRLEGDSARDKDCSPVLDDSVAVMRATDRSGRILLTLANYAKHPTVAAESNLLASADFVWGYREDVERATGAPAMFLQGPEAAVHGKYSYDDSAQMWDHVHEIGSDLARAVLAAPLSRSDAFGIRSRAATYSCACGDTFLSMALSAMDMPKRHVTTLPDDTYVVDEIEVSWHQVGPAEFVVFPGEPTPEYGEMAKQRIVSPFQFAVALGNDSIGYMVDPGSLAADVSGQLSGYELMMGLGAGSGPAAWTALAGLGWFDGAWQDEEVSR